jgi:hypoxanthine-DNA glycosylase
MTSSAAIDDNARGFPPVADGASKILILGSMPGRRSLAEQQYYAHRQNAFWPIMKVLIGAGFELSYAERIEKLHAAGIAVWDVLASCERPGSLDSAIDDSTALVNDFSQFFKRHRRIRRVCFNGRKAADIYRRQVLPEMALEAPYLAHTRLPSTSPAHAAMRFEAKLDAWRDALFPSNADETDL